MIRPCQVRVFAITALSATDSAGEFRLEPSNISSRRTNQTLVRSISVLMQTSNEKIGIYLTFVTAPWDVATFCSTVAESESRLCDSQLLSRQPESLDAARQTIFELVITAGGTLRQHGNDDEDGAFTDSRLPYGPSELSELQNPFFFLMDADGRIRSVLVAEAETPRIATLKKNIVSQLQVVLPADNSNANGNDNAAAGFGTRVLRASADADDVGLGINRERVLLGGAALPLEWTSDEVDSTGTYRALYTSSASSSATSSVSRARKTAAELANDAVTVTKVRSLDSYFSLGDGSSHSPSHLQDGSLHIEASAKYRLHAATGHLLRADITSTIGLRGAGRGSMPVPGTQQSATDTWAETPQLDMTLTRTATASIVLLGSVPLASINTATAAMASTSTSKAARRPTAMSSGASSVPKPGLHGVDFAGKPFQLHGLSVLRSMSLGSDTGGDGSARRAAAAQPAATNSVHFRTESLIVRESDQDSDAAAKYASEAAAELEANGDMDPQLLALLAETRTMRRKTGVEDDGSSYLDLSTRRQVGSEALKSSLSSYLHNFDVDADADGDDWNADPEDIEVHSGENGDAEAHDTSILAATERRMSRLKARVGAASSPLERLLQSLTCLPPFMFDDSLDSSHPEGMGPCILLINNATNDILVKREMHRLMISNPCVNVHASIGAVLSHPSIQSKHAQSYIDASVEQAPFWEQNCHDGAYAEITLSHRLVDMFVSSMLTTDAVMVADSEAMLIHMLLRPDLYRYATVLEHAAQAAGVFEAPSEALIESLWHVATHISDQSEVVLLHEDPVLSMTLLALGGAVHNARSFHTHGRPAFDPRHFFATDGFLQHDADKAHQRLLSARRGNYDAAAWDERLLSKLYPHLARAKQALDARAEHVRMATELAVATWPTLPVHRRLAYMSAGDGIPTRDLQRLLLISVEQDNAGRDRGHGARALSLSAREELELRGAAVLRDILLKMSFGRPDKLEEMRFALARSLATSNIPGGPAANVESLQSDPETVANSRRLAKAFEAGGDAEKVHRDRVAAARLLVHEPSNVAQAVSDTELVLRVLANAGLRPATSIALNFTMHESGRLREAAMHVLQRVGASAPIPADHANVRLLHAVAEEGIDPAAQLLLSYLEPHSAAAISRRSLSQAEVNGARPETVSAAEQPVTSSADHHYFRHLASFTDPAASRSIHVRSLASHRSLFPHATIGTHAVDIEEHLLEVATSHHDVATQIAAISALSHARPLRHSTVDALLEYYEQRLSTVNQKACTYQCASDLPACRVLPLAACYQRCERKCGDIGRLISAFSEFFVLRVQDEAADDTGSNDEWPAPTPSVGRRLAEASRRSLDMLLRQAAALEANPSESYEKLVEAYAAGELSDHNVAQRLLSASSIHADAPVGTAPNYGNTTSALLRRALRSDSDYSARVLSDPILSNKRILSYRTLDGRPNPRHLSRARRLGIFTLIDAQLGSGMLYDKKFGSNDFNLRITFINKNIIKLRISLFDGVIRIEEWKQLILAAKVRSSRETSCDGANVHQLLQFACGSIPTSACHHSLIT